MKHFIKLALLLLFLVGAFTLSGCGSKVKEDKKDTPQLTNEQTKPLSEERKAELDTEVKDAPMEDKIVNQANENPIKELAALESKWNLTELHKLVIKSDDITDQWIYGNIIYNQYIMEMYTLKKDFDKFYSDTQAVYKEKDFANKLKDEPQYTNGLMYGQKMRDNVKEFFDMTFEGVKDSEGKIIDVSGEKYKELYKEKMVKQYNDDYRKLNAALNNILK